MTPQERDLILGLFQRLTPPPAGDIDQEARELIDRLGREQPLALYMLAQTALVQEHALKGAQARIAELEAKLAVDWTDLDLLTAHREARSDLEALLRRWEALFEESGSSTR